MTADRWSPPPDRLVCTADAVHVWRARLDWPRATLARLESVLAADERERMARFHFEPDRRRFLIGRGALRLLLGDYLGTTPEALRFAYSPYGKPGLIADQLQFNVSHSGDLVLIAAAHGRAVGIDVERISPQTRLQEVAARFFSSHEQQSLAALASALQREAFFACWTRKEAYIKALGNGLSMPLDRFDVAILPGEPAALIATRPDPAEAQRWTVTDLAVGDGYKGALAVEGRGWKLRRFDWQG
jgi:4'-phosphopantetheinyl transferase